MDESKANEGRGAQLAAVGAVVGLVPAAVLGSLRFLNAEAPEATAQIAGNIVFALIYLSPYALALAASMVRNPASRGGLLLAIGLLSLIASFSTFSLVSVVLLPATIIIWIAAVRSLRASSRSLTTAIPSFATGLLISGLLGFSFFTLLMIQEPEPRCWELVEGTAGQSQWESRPFVGEEGESFRVVMGGSGLRSLCVSDVITNTEATMTLGIIAMAFLGAWGFIAWTGRRSSLAAQ